MGKQKILSIGMMALLVSGLLQGCATPPKVIEIAEKPEQKDVLNPYFKPPEEGSLWSDTANMLFVDKRARRVGDTVTIDIVENTSSKIGANTKAERTTSLDADVPHLLGWVRDLEAGNPNLNRDISGARTNKLLKAGVTNNFEGKGSSDRSGSVTASIGGRVVDVLPNGNLLIYGKREMKVNNEVQLITVTGIARTEDIDSDNRIKSTYLADAMIEYSGKGVLADKQRPGWFTRLVDKIWPF